MIRSILGVLILLAAIAYVWWPADPPRGTSTPQPDGGASPAGSKAAEIRGDAPRTGSASQAAAPGNGERVQPPRPLPSAGPASESPIETLRIALGWEPGDPNAVELDQWQREVQVHLREFEEVYAREERSDDEVRDGARQLNETITREREKLVEKIGKKAANEALRVVKVYQFDMDRGSWHRVDAEGKRIPFSDEEKESLWENFTRRR